MASSSTTTTGISDKTAAAPLTEEQESLHAPSTEAATSDEESVTDCFADMGFMFEGNQPSKLVHFKWKTGVTKRPVAVAVSAADDEPGAVISGHYLWPAAEMLATYLLEQETRLRPVTVVELGAGCALASLAALQIWQDVLQCLVVTDHDPGTLERACDNHESTLQELLDSSLTDEALNSAINDLGSIPVFFQGLEWGKQDALLSIREILQEHTNTRKGCFDVVLGSDLIYCLQVVEPLFQTVADLMTLGQHSVFILTQSFAYEEETEGEIDRVCEELGLLRTLISDDGKGNRIQEFGRQQQHQLQEQQAVAKGNVADLQEPE